jgi:hypothetical protein
MNGFFKYEHARKTLKLNQLLLPVAAAKEYIREVQINITLTHTISVATSLTGAKVAQSV